MSDDLRVLVLVGDQFQVVPGMIVFRIENRLPGSEITVCLSPRALHFPLPLLLDSLHTTPYILYRCS